MGVSHVIQIGSYTKTLSAAIRCGYIISDLAKIERLIDLKIATSFSNSNLNAEIIYQSLIDSSYPKHLDGLKKQLVKATNEVIYKLAQLNIHPWITPKAGLFLWCTLPHHIEASKLSKICLKQGVILAPGNSFSQSEHAGQFMRFNVAQCLDKKVFDVLSHAIEHYQNDS